jgi:hypothetical protein
MDTLSCMTSTEFSELGVFLSCVEGILAVLSYVARRGRFTRAGVWYECVCPNRVCSRCVGNVYDVMHMSES